LRRARIDGLVAQHEIRVRGRVVARVDFAVPAARLAIEADSYRWHSGRKNWQEDLARRNALTSLGWRVIHVTWGDLDDARRIVKQVEQALRARL
jgi:very-short-patch-repair endonuclease